MTDTEVVAGAETETAEAGASGSLAPADRLFWVMPDMILLDKNGRPKLIFTVEQVARVFFGYSGSWLRLKMKPDKDHPDTYFVLNGQRMEFSRQASYGKPAEARENDLSARFFTLADIEPMAYSLFSFGSISEEKLRAAIQLVKWEARLWHILEG
jgi:hypothetical protein